MWSYHPASRQRQRHNYHREGPPANNVVSQNKVINKTFNQNNTRIENENSNSVDITQYSKLYHDNILLETQQLRLEMNQTLTKMHELQKEESGKTPVRFNYQLNQKPNIESGMIF